MQACYELTGSYSTLLQQQQQAHIKPSNNNKQTAVLWGVRPAALGWS
jgi:hypothetical protein